MGKDFWSSFSERPAPGSDRRIGKSFCQCMQLRLSGFVGRLFFRVDGVELEFGIMFSKCPSHLPDVGHIPIGRR